MRNTHKLPVQNKSNPTTPRVKPDMDELAKLWIEMVLQQIQKAPVVFSENSSYNNVIGQLDIRKL